MKKVAIAQSIRLIILIELCRSWRSSSATRLDRGPLAALTDRRSDSTSRSCSLRHRGVAGDGVAAACRAAGSSAGCSRARRCFCPASSRCGCPAFLVVPCIDRARRDRRQPLSPGRSARPAPYRRSRRSVAFPIAGDAVGDRGRPGDAALRRQHHPDAARLRARRARSAGMLAYQMNIDPAYVAAHHVVRFVALVVAVPLVARWLASESVGRASAPPLVVMPWLEPSASTPKVGRVATVREWIAGSVPACRSSVRAADSCIRQGGEAVASRRRRRKSRARRATCSTVAGPSSGRSSAFHVSTSASASWRSARRRGTAWR